MSGPGEPALAGSAVLIVAASAMTGILVGASVVATRLVIHQTDPATLALLRYAIGCACLAPAIVAAKRVRFARRDLVPIALLGIGQFGVLVVLLNFGLQFIGAGLAAIIFTILPLLSLVLGATLHSEALTGAKTVGVALTIAGVGLAMGHEISDSDAARSAWLGSAAVVLSAAIGATCSVLYRPYLERYPPLHVGAYAMLASVVVLAIAAPFTGGFDQIPAFGLIGWLAVLFIGASSGLGYFLWLWALRATTPTRVNIFLALSPITAVALGALFLGEAVSALFFAGLISVATGLVLAHWRPHT